MIDTAACDICWAIIVDTKLDEHRNRHSEVHSPWDHEPGLKIETTHGNRLLSVRMCDRNGFIGCSNWRDEGGASYRVAWDALNRARPGERQ